MLDKQVDVTFNKETDKFTLYIWGGDARDLDILRHEGYKFRRIYWWETFVKKLAAYAKKYKWREELVET